LEKEAKTFAWVSPASPRQPRKSFLVLFCKKELLSLLLLAYAADERRVQDLSPALDIAPRLDSGLNTHRVPLFGIVWFAGLFILTAIP
jgi:hypothetical protein